MKNISLFLVSCFIVSGCGKTIVYGDLPANTNNRENLVIYRNNNTSSYNNNATGYILNTNQQQNAQNVEGIDNSQSNVSQYKTNNDNYNLYQQNNAQQNVISQNDVNYNNTDLLLEQAMNGDGSAKSSALLVNEQQKGQVELSSREVFNSTNKTTVGYNTEYNSQNISNNNIVSTNDINNDKYDYFVKEKPKVKYSSNLNSQNITVRNKVNTTNDFMNIQQNQRKSYKIQCGNYVNKKAAISIANKLKQAGIENVNIVTDGSTHRILVGDFNNKSDGIDVFEKIEKLDLQDRIFWTFR